MFMRFFGGGVGHNGTGVSVKQSQHRAERVERRGHPVSVLVDSERSSESSDQDEEHGEFSGACEEAEQVLNEALQALEESDEEDEEEDLTEVLLADPNEDEEIEWGDLFAPVDADESQAIQGEEEDEEDEDKDEEDGDLYADYPWL